MRRVLLLSLFVFSFRALTNAQTAKPEAKAQTAPVTASSPSPVAAQAARAFFAKLPLSFEENVGQTDPHVKYTSRGAGYSLFLTQDEAVIALRGGAARADCGIAQKIHSDCANQANTRPEESVLWLKMLGANSSAQIAATDPLPGRINYYIGNDPAKWRTGVRQYGRVSYRGIYPGVDLTYYGNQQQLESDFIVAPGASPRSIEFEAAGARDVRIDAQGNVILATNAGDARLLRPVAYQMIHNVRHEVTSRYVLRGANRVGLSIGPYNRHEKLIIDPTFVYSTFLGGSNLFGGDQALSIAIDATGHAFIAGQGESSDFPTTESSGPPNEFRSSFAFVTELDATGSSGSPGQLIYSTILAGTTGFDTTSGNGISVSGGIAYITGSTGSTDFPVLNPAQATYGAPSNNGGPFQTGFIASLDAGGMLNFSTFWGGRNANDTTNLNGIFADATGNSYVVGETTSANFPTINSLPFTLGFGSNVVVAKFNSTGQPVYSTYLSGANSDDTGTAIVADSSGNAYLTGQTFSNAFPLQSSPAPFQSTLNGSPNAFVTKLAFNSGTSVLSIANSTYLGGNRSDKAWGIAIDSASPPNVYLTGQTTSTNFPTQNPISGTFTSGTYSGAAYGGVASTSNPDPTEAFVTKLNGTFSALVFSTYLGGSGPDIGYGIGLDGSNNVFVTGSTTSANFPLNLPLQVALGAPSATNVFLAELPSTGNSITYSTLLGGTGTDEARAIAVDSTGNAYIAGKTTSANFPLMSGGTAGTNPFQDQLGSSSGNAFIAKVSPTPATGLTLFPNSFNFHDVGIGASATEVVTLTNNSASGITISSFAFGGTNSGDFSLIAASPSPCSLTVGFMLAAGSSCDLTIAFAPQDQDTRTATFTVNGSTTMNLSGSGGAPQVSFNTTSIQFFPNPDPLNVQAISGVTITNTGGGPLRVGSAQISASTPANAAPFSTTGSGCFNAPINPGSSCTIDVYFTPTVAGTFNATLLLNTNAAGSPQTLPVTGSAIAEVVVQPKSLELGTQVVGSTSTENSSTASLVNGSGEAINVTVTPGTGPDQADFHVFNQGNSLSCATVGLLSPGGTCDLPVYFQPLAASATDGRTGSYTIGWTGTAVASVVPGSQVVNVMGTGVTGISLYTNSLTAPNEFVGFKESSSGLEFLYNGTPNPITVTIAITGNNPGDFDAQVDSNCAPGGVVPANTYCRVDLSFKPSAVGLRTATVAFNYTGVSSGQLLLSGSGTGIPGPVIVSSTNNEFQILSFDFGSEITGTTTPEKIFQVRNVATVPLSSISVTPPGNADFKIVASDTTCPIAPASGAIPGGASCFIALAFAPSSTTKETSSFVVTDSYSPNGVDASSPHTVNLSGTGEPPAITISVSSGGNQILDFGNVQPNPSPVAQGAIFLTNASNQPTTITLPATKGAVPTLNTASTVFTILTSGNYATTCVGQAVVLPQGGSCVIGVSFNPTTSTVGEQTDSVTFADSTGGSHTVTIQGNPSPQGKVSWTATTPFTTFTSLSFNAVEGATSSSQTAKLFNVGSGPLTITGIPEFLSTGTSASTFTILPSSTCTVGAVVASGSSCVFDMTFTAPATTGTSSGELEVQASLGNNATGFAILSFNGTAYAGGFALSPAAPIVFGPVAVGSTATSAGYTLTNENPTSVTLGALSVPAGYTLLGDSCSSQVLTAGNACFFSLQFAPTSAISYNGNLSIPFTGASGSPFTVALQGSGSTAVVANPNPLNFQAFVNSTSFETVTIANGSGSSATITGVSAFTGPNAGDYSVSFNGCFIGDALTASGGTCTIDINFLSATAGTFSTSFNVSYSIGAVAQTPITVNITATIPSALAVITTPAPPNPLNFGSQTVNTQSAVMNVVLSNSASATQALQVSGTQIAGNDFALAGFVNCFFVNPGQSCVIPITFTPSAAGARTGTLTITDNSTTTTQTVSLQGTGVAGAVTASPATMNFPTTNIGSSVTLGAVLSNTTGSAVTLSSVNFSGPYSLDTGAGTCAIGAKIGAVTGSCVVYIKFTPSGATNAGTATINTTGGSPQITLSGTGVNPNVNVNPTSLTFSGQAIGTTSVSQTVTVGNPTNASVNVTSSSFSGTNPSDFALVNNNCTGKTVASGANCTLGVTFTPGVSGGANRSATLTISDTSAGAPTLTVTLSGTAIAPVATLSSGTIAFGNSNVGVTTAQQSVSLTNTGTATLSISSIVLGGANAGDFAIVAPSSGTQCTNITSLAPSASCNIAATFDPTALNSRSATITITDNANPATQVITLTGMGTQPAVSLLPTSIGFGSQLIHTASGQLTTVLTNSGSGPLTINGSGVSITGTNAGDFALVTPSAAGVTNCVSASALIVPAAGTCTIAVTFTPSATGSRSASISILDSASGSPQTVPLSGTGTEPVVSLNPSTTLAFGNEIDGVTSTQQTVTLTNTGTTSLSLATVALSGANSADFVIVSGAGTTCTNGATIGFTAPNNTCTVTLTFTPGVAGVRAATLTFTDNSNGTAGSTQMLNLTGTGQTPPTATLSIASVPFGNQQVGTASAATTITITNSGDATLTIASLVLDASGNPGDFLLTAGATNPCSLPSGTVAGHSSCTFNVVFKPTATGARAATVDITGNGNATGTPGTKQTIGLTGTGTAPTAQIATTLAFGNQPINQTATLPLMLTNTGTAPLVLAATNAVAITTGTNSTLFGIANSTTCTNSLSIAPSGTCTINVTFTPTAVGTFGPVTLVITDNSGAVAGTTQSVALSGSGVAASVNFSPSPVNFTPSQNVGMPSANMTVTLTNSGGLGVQLAASNAVAISGTNASDFAIVSSGTTCTNGAIVAANGGSCVVILTFTPSAIGPRTAILTVTDNANPTTQNVTLNGTGIAPVASVPASLAFGNEIDGVTSTQQTITLTNSGTASLTLTSFALSGANSSDFAIVSGAGTTCVAGGTVGFTPPNNTCKVTLTFTPGAAGPRVATLTFTDNSNDVAGSTQPVSLTGTGQTPPTATLSTAAVTFGNQRQGTASPVTTITISNNGDATLTIASIALDVAGNTGDFLLTAGTTSPCTLAGGTVAGHASCTFNVAFKPTTTGARAATVDITANGNATGTPGTKQTVALSGTGTAPAAQVLSTLAFGNATINQTATLPLTLKNTGTDSLNLAATNPLAISGTNAALFGIGSGTTCTASLAIAPNATCTINVTFAPTAVASDTATLTITDDSGAVAGTTQTVTLTGSGVTSTVNFNPTSLTFPGQRVGTTSAQMSSVLTNSATSSLSIASVTITGANASDFALVAPASGTNCVGVGSVGASGTCTIAVTFTPGATGTRTATVSVADNATGSPHTFTLTGTGTQPAVSINSIAVNPFANQIQTTTSAAQTITVTNTGTATLDIATVVLGGTNAAQFAIVSGSGTTCTNGSTVGFTAPNNTCTIAVTFTPPTATSFSATITLTDDASPTTQVINLTGTGVTPPTATPSPTSLTFTSQAIGTTSAAQTVTLTNSGGAPLSVTSISLTGANAGDFAFASPATTCPTSTSGQVAPNSSCTLSVTFNPAATGSRTAGITITVTGIANQAPITLTGTGTAPDVAITKSHTGSFEVGGTGSYTIALKNNGTAATHSTITVTDTLPGGLTFSSGTGTGWTCSAAAQVVTCTNPGPIAISATSTITLNVTVGSAAFPSVINSATVADTGDSGTSDKNSTDSPTTITAPDVTLTKSHTGDFTVGGTSNVYTFTVTNKGTGPTNGNIVVTDTLPAGLGLVSNTGSGWACAAGAQNAQLVTCTYTGVALAATNGTSTFTMTVSVAPSAFPSVTNSATVSDPNDGKTTDKSATDTVTNVDNAMPSESAISPSAGVIAGATSAQQLTITGTGLNSSTQVILGTNPAITLTGGTANAAGTSLVITVPANDLTTANAGNLTVTVKNPPNPSSNAGGGTATTPQMFPLVAVTGAQDSSTSGTITVTAGTPAMVKINYTTNPANTPLPAALMISCTVPQSLTGATCTPGAATIAAGATGASASSTITITAVPTSSGSSTSAPWMGGRGPWTPYLLWLVVAALLSMLALMRSVRQRAPQFGQAPAYLTLLLLVIAAGALVGCTTAAKATPTPTGPSTVTVMATTADGATVSTTVNINVVN